jgi:hypothetical protein
MSRLEPVLTQELAMRRRNGATPDRAGFERDDLDTPGDGSLLQPRWAVRERCDATIKA